MKRDLLAKGFLLLTLSTSILFICFSIDLVHVLATTTKTSTVAGQTHVYILGNQLAIYKRGQGFELGTTKNKSLIFNHSS